MIVCKMTKKAVTVCKKSNYCCKMTVYMKGKYSLQGSNVSNLQDDSLQDKGIDAVYMSMMYSFL